MNKPIQLFLSIGLLISSGSLFSQTNQTSEIKNKISPSTQSKQSSKKSNSSHVRTFVALGDSLTEGYQLSSKDAYPYLLEIRLNKEFPKYKTKVINAGISGSTTSFGFLRLEKHLPLKPHAVLIALGSNDGLRGTPIEKIKTNLQNTINMAQSHNISVLLAGFKLPMNYGTQYRQSFENIFKDLARKNKITYIPFLLEGVAGQPELNLHDLIHPNEKGHKVMAKTLYPYFKQFYKKSD